jgi:NADPH2:quinone reductase
MFFGPYGVLEDGAYGEWIAARPEDLCLIPESLDDATAGWRPDSLSHSTGHTHAGWL